MTLEQMKESFNTIELLEKDLMRDLTKEEKEVVINDGWEEFLFGHNHLNLTEDDYKEIKAIKAIVSAFYTQDEGTYEDLIKNAPKGIYPVLRDILDKLDDFTPCANPKCLNKESGELPLQDEVPSIEMKDPMEEFVKFLGDLYLSLPKMDAKWFNKVSAEGFEKLFDIYKEERNDKRDCTDDVLGCLLTDTVKDEVVKEMAERLKKGEAVEMSNDEYMEVADYLCQNEDKIFLTNENGTVRLTLL